MTSLKSLLPTILENERTPLVDLLLEIIQRQEQRISDLEDEIQDLKKETKKPKFESSKMDEKTEEPPSEEKKKRTPRKNKKNLNIHNEQIIQPEFIPENARFKGYRNIVVQDIRLSQYNTRYRLAQYQTTNGTYISAQLPEGIYNGHWGSTLHRFILYQYHHQHVTQPLLLEQLHDFDIDISSGQLSHLITENLTDFHQEKDQILQAGIENASYIQVDDTGACHAGQKGYCTHIGNEFFAWFKSTDSKNRINFLELIHEGKPVTFIFDTESLKYMEDHKLPKWIIDKLEKSEVKISSKAVLIAYLNEAQITQLRHQRIITEGVLMGSLLRDVVPENLAVVSDDAGQFNVFDHALCWVHAERLIHRLIPLNEEHKKALDWIRAQIWEFYRDLKAYKKASKEVQKSQKEQLKDDFNAIFQTQTSYETLNRQLKRIGKNQSELLRVLDRPELPLHNNLSESDIRDYVKKRKISGSTRSENGRRSRDTFASLKKTCRKHGISFWEYLIDRISKDNLIPPLSEVIRRATCGL